MSSPIDKQEKRIYKHYQSLRHSGKHHAGVHINFGHEPNDDELILYLARHWKMSCKQIKTIVRYYQEKNKKNNPPDTRFLDYLSRKLTDGNK